MTATITANNGAGSTTPHFIAAPYVTNWSSRNKVHPLIGGGIDITLTPSSPRVGSLQLFYLTEVDAYAAVELHRQMSTFTLVESDEPHVDMTYVLSDAGTITVELQPDASAVLVTVPYQELVA